jgi:hypothetical protein
MISNLMKSRGGDSVIGIMKLFLERHACNIFI